MESFIVPKAPYSEGFTGADERTPRRLAQNAAVRFNKTATCV